MEARTKALLDFLDASHSQYHAAAYLAAELRKAGYTCLPEGEDWNLLPGGKYYLTRGGSAVLAFRIPRGEPSGFLISASHCDRPCFKLKENGELAGTYTRLASEKYGGMLIAPWLDRPLSVAGRVLVETEKGLETRLVDIDRNIAMMPNVAIHMNRNANDGYKYDLKSDTVAVLGSEKVKGKLKEELEQQAGGKIPRKGHPLGFGRGIHRLCRHRRSGVCLGLHPGLPPGRRGKCHSCSVCV